ncbi:MAG: hypothetical protein FWE82_04185 [Defluviitaleaceae bacterium]|nr:hypothetical protein [Defluviitaleaceae bacterium]
MNAKQRHIAALTFGSPDKIPFSPGYPRESTIKKWQSQGLPKNQNYIEALGELLGFTPDPHTVGYPAVTRMIPAFEEEVLERRDGHLIVRDWMGAVVEISDCFDVSYLRAAKDFVTRKWHRFPVNNRDDWIEMKRRYDAKDEQRYGDLLHAKNEADKLGSPIFWAVNGPFWQLREWMGFEGLCVAMHDEPDFVFEMADFWNNFVADVLKRACETCVPDHIMINEDMAYKAHAMISPSMTREYVLPSYVNWKKISFNAGTAVFDVDSDGYIGTLLPLWVEAGVNCNSPVEVAAMNDIVAFRGQYGESMAYRGGIDKRCIAAGGDALKNEVMRVVPPMQKAGGFIPGCDHGVPPDISWQNFIKYSRLLAQLGGWI